MRDQLRSEILQIEDLFTEFEGIFLTVAKRVDKRVPSGDRWHRDLLDQVAAATDLRPSLISKETKESLQPYLAFRHFFRQAYVYVLHWEEMRDLVNGLASTWARTKTEIEAWLEN